MVLRHRASVQRIFRQEWMKLLCYAWGARFTKNCISLCVLLLERWVDIFKNCFLCSKENTSWQREWEEVFDEVRLLGPLHWASWRDWTWGETNQKQAKSFKGSTSLLYLVNHRGPVATRMLKTKKLSLGINVAENNPDWTGLPVADGGESFHGSKNHWSLLPTRRRHRLKDCNSSLYHSFLLPFHCCCLQ